MPTARSYCGVDGAGGVYPFERILLNCLLCADPQPGVIGKSRMPYIDESLKRFIDDLSSRTPTPGGGSASALGGALGLGLASMAALYTTGNEKFKAAEPQAKALDDALTALRRKLLATIEADIQAYGAYAEARKLPKSTPEEKAVRSAR